MTILHVNILDADRHEPKGISTATIGQVYVADGAASGAWTSPVYGELLVDTSAAAFTPGAADITSFKQMTNANNVLWEPGVSSGVTIGTNTITLDGAGDYQINFWGILISSASASTQFAIKYALDGTLNTRQVIVQKNSSGADSILTTASGIVTATAGQVLSLWMASNLTTTVVVQNAGFSVVKLS